MVRTWKRPWRVVSAVGQHVHGLDDIAAGRWRELKITRMRPYADPSLDITRVIPSRRFLLNTTKAGTSRHGLMRIMATGVALVFVLRWPRRWVAFSLKTKFPAVGGMEWALKVVSRAPSTDPAGNVRLLSAIMSKTRARKKSGKEARSDERRSRVRMMVARNMQTKTTMEK